MAPRPASEYAEGEIDLNAAFPPDVAKQDRERERAERDAKARADLKAKVLGDPSMAAIVPQLLTAPDPVASDVMLPDAEFVEADKARAVQHARKGTVLGRLLDDIAKGERSAHVGHVEPQAPDQYQERDEPF